LVIISLNKNKKYHPAREEIMKQIGFKSKCKIDKVDVTGDTLTGRGRMALFVRYLGKINIYGLLLEFFGHLRRSQNGKPIWSIFRQVFCFFYMRMVSGNGNSVLIRAVFGDKEWPWGVNLEFIFLTPL